jgi:hypothetical protein
MKNIKILTIKEIETLKGGEEVKNNNRIIGCICYYNDTPNLINDNFVDGCTCQCAKPI